MRHLGDITRISGYTAPVVDAVIGGSPCQGLSQAGKRRGLADERSGLFMEQIRVIKEMREADARTGRTGQFVRPRFMVWENVPGAFSSGEPKGEDFRIVLEETIRIAEPDAPDIPLPPKGKWPLADCWYGDGWSVAYRVLDAQFWGVPQRRRRIALVADFGGHAAPEILFVRKGVCGDATESGETGEKAATGAGSGAYPAIARSLTARYDGSPCIDRGPNIVYDAKGNGERQDRVTDCTEVAIGYAPPIAHALRASAPDTMRDDMDTYVVTAVDCRNGTESSEVVATLQAHSNGGFSINCTHPVRIGGQVRRLTPLECERLQGYPDGWTVLPAIQDMSNDEYEFWKKVLFENGIREGKIRQNEAGEYEKWRKVKIMHSDDEAEDEVWENTHKIYRHKTKVQIVKWYNKSFVSNTDSARYEALGNSIALPPWAWVLKRLCACYERPATMASLFDGIGGFPLIWERLNGPGSCLWASEIEEFPMAVTKVRFGGNDEAIDNQNAEGRGIENE